MKQNQTLHLFLVLVISVFSASALQAQSQTTDITDNFFSKYAKDPIRAFDYAFSTNKYFDLKNESVIDVKNKLENAVNQCGKYYGYELIMEKTTGNCLKIVSYFVKYDRQPLRLTFIFYKSNEKWQVQNLSFSPEFDDELQDAIKLNLVPDKK
ncbi:MAG: hypothetical protein EBU33_03930 [Sphingobacteriia bacterium]|jgi:hypothetical protein|nr:hypothetical protein [Sphingobacteriia bacterium]